MLTFAEPTWPRTPVKQRFVSKDWRGTQEQRHAESEWRERLGVLYAQTRRAALEGTHHEQQEAQAT